MFGLCCGDTVCGRAKLLYRYLWLSEQSSSTGVLNEEVGARCLRIVLCLHCFKAFPYDCMYVPDRLKAEYVCKGCCQECSGP